ncbi:uncharacterized protein A1O9_10306 [Exophiala aquamarina CBS 119918]|uniref:FAD-binding domain-containing protein n=1 Tax=Exophiala aquamarina CBS 119918 TaxID=1182545 RepID=A0A072P1B1_9EURO|nr:uncharacterized protein A1O9_10306 [Exophiala aquamarina CBS 119918]KEF53904.1 hypothetical protein A1O9_10306 [Exophiala aquamarina CBS 119918]
MCQTTYATSLGGDGPYDRKVLYTTSAFGGDEGSEMLRKFMHVAPERPTNLPLSRSEPIWRAVAESRNPGNIKFSHRVVDFTQKGDCVDLRVEGPNGPQVYQVQYLVAAEGGGGIVRSKLGIQMQGPKNIANVVSVHFKADLSNYWDDRTLIAAFINPEGETLLGSGSLIQLGPTWGRYSEEWGLHFEGLPADNPNRSREDEPEILKARIRSLLKIHNIDIEILNVSHWVIERVLAERYQDGRIFLVGDAAHRRPPTTGLGLNGSIEDANNIAWKLAQVIHGKASPKLLETYEQERRLIGKRNCDWGLMTFANTSVLNAALGFVPGQKATNMARLAALLEESDIGATYRSQLQHIFSAQVTEYSALDLELGFSYWQGGAFLPDGTERPAIDPLGQSYIQTSRPGHRLPHIWLEIDGDRSQKPLSTHDLMNNDYDYLLITDQYGTSWIEAVQKSAKLLRLTIGVAQIGPLAAGLRPCKYIDRGDRWATESGLRKGGAILVRPDNFVAWRQCDGSLNGGKELATALETLVGDCVGHDIPFNPYTTNGFYEQHKTSHVNGFHTRNC